MNGQTVNSGQRLSCKLRRLIVLTSFGAILLLAGLAYRHYWLSLPMGEGPAGPPVARQSFNLPWTPRKVLLLGVGDSVTAGFGVTQPYSYFGRLVENPPDEFSDMQGISLSAVLPNLSARNIAVSGSTSLEHVAYLRERLKTQEADTLGLVVMTTGGNDLIHSYGRLPPREGAMYGATLELARPWIASFEKRLDEMIDLLEQRFPGGCFVFLADIYDPTDGIGDATRAGLPPWSEGLAVHRAYQKVIHRCAAERESVYLVPMHEAFLGHGIHCRQFWRDCYRSKDPHYWYASNLEDPNIRGYDAIRRLFLNEIVKIPDYR
ncbi:MAG: SGNH/GDSL hydrolase family protein [Rhodopirellula sp.]|nr:SGNH/GDSL hydrolase family protein [Rhodopirellula sp.]